MFSDYFVISTPYAHNAFNKIKIYILIILHVVVYFLYVLVQLEDGLTQAETCSCNYVCNRQALCLTDIYWLDC
jgi:hypothetical protein